jgi:DNA (cytosine-5)-methyltransferase 1
VAFVEVEAAIIENLVVGMEAGKLAPAPVWANIKTFPWRAFHGKIFLFLGGYPCQPFSSAGKRKGKADPRHLWPHIERGIFTARSVCVFFENVYGHLSLGFDQVTESLRSMGYAVEAGVFTASEVGAPHKRARVFILGILANAKDNVRGLYERQWKSGTTPADFTGTGEMDHARSIRHGSEYPISARRNGAELTGQAMANPTSVCEREPDNSGHAVPGIRETRKISGFGGATLADSIGQGLEESGEQSAREERQTIKQGGIALVHPNVCRPQFGDITGVGRAQESSAWPAGPGQPQYAWECSRTIESGMGCTINGYDFREDLLRALGNGVVEQTAELALRTLLRKHFE